MIVEVPTDPPCPVHLGPDLLEGVGGVVDELEGVDRVGVVADARVLELYGHRLSGLERAPRHVLPSGEACKTLAQLEQTLLALADMGLSRSSVVVTLGGGTVTDAGGLAASLFKRGVRVVHVATTLLSQVDAAIGGKTAVNLAGAKNLVGSFHAPSAILCDSSVLASLSDVEWRSGLGEVVKTAMIGGEEDLARVEASAEALVAREPGAVEEVVRRCVQTKGRVCAEDPLERGPRRVLNLGHTFGHAIEAAAGPGGVPHGEAVACGIGMALEAAREVGLLEDPQLPGRLRKLFERLGLPRTILDLRQDGRALLPVALMDAIAHDKKGRFGEPEFVLPRAPGRFDLSVKLDEDLLDHLLR